MWWYYVKKIDNADKIIYLYGRETETVSGELMYNKKNKKYSVLKQADGDTEKMAHWALQYLLAVIEAGCPDKKMVAIG